MIWHEKCKAAKCHDKLFFFFFGVYRVLEESSPYIHTHACADNGT